MPIWDNLIVIKGMVPPGVDFPQDPIEIDDDLIIKKGEKGSCALHLQVETEEEEDVAVSRNKLLADERALNFASLYECFSGRSVDIKSGGSGMIGGERKFGDFGGMFLEIEELGFPPEKRADETGKAHRIIRNYVEFFKNYEKTIVQNPYLKHAIHYYYHSTKTARYEERLVYLTTALESLFGRETQGLSYRLSLRVASLIGRAFVGMTPSDVSNDIKKLYEKRSEVVHGVAKDGDSVSFDDIHKLEGYVRKAIRVYLSIAQRMGKDSILDLLDDSLVDEERKKQLGDIVRGIESA